jgi:hypothetical protein
MRYGWRSHQQLLVTIAGFVFDSLAKNRRMFYEDSAFFLKGIELGIGSFVKSASGCYPRLLGSS